MSMQRTGKFLLIILLFSLLSGCLYPNQRRTADDFTTLTFEINTVKEASLHYLKEVGSLPVMEKHENAPIYEQNRIDFSKLYPDYLSSIPPDSFERGGHFLYLFYLYGEEIEVKLIDLTMSNVVRDVQQKVWEYKANHGVYPVKGKLNPEQYEIDVEKLGINKPTVTSPFTGEPLLLYLSSEGEVWIDYSSDIAAYHKKGYPFPGEDARRILLENSYFIPVKSFPYRWKGDRAVLAPDLPR